MGGRYDATNSLDVDAWKSYACGITKLDYDHVRVLGHRLEQIAWEKAGIFLKNKLEPGTPRPPDDGDENATASMMPPNQKTKKSLSVQDNCKYFALDPRNETVQHVLEECAELEPLCFVAGSYERILPPDASIGLAGTHQRDNAELAMALCKSVCGTSVASTQVHEALAQAQWLGRCQTIALESNLNIRLDGAHTVESVQVGLEWFNQVTTGAQRHLIFNCSHERNPVELLERFLPLGFHSVFFCKADSERPSAIQKKSAKELLRTWRSSKRKRENYNDDDDDHRLAHLPDHPEATWQETLSNIWCALEEELVPKKNKALTSGSMTLSAALDQIQQSLNQEAVPKEVLVAGSLYLVGSALSALSWKEVDAEGSLMADEL